MNLKKYAVIIFTFLFIFTQLVIFDLNRKPSEQVSAKILIFSIVKYQKIISPGIIGYVRCKFTPSCSDYAILAIKKYGVFKGTLKTINRLYRCSPLTDDRGLDYP